MYPFKKYIENSYLNYQIIFFFEEYHPLVIYEKNSNNDYF